MKEYIKYIIVIILLLMTTKTAVYSANNKEALLLKEMSSIKGPKRLYYLKQLMHVTYGTDKQLVYICKLRDEAKSYDSLDIAAQAMTESCVFFLNHNMMDSLLYWGPKTMAYCDKIHNLEFYYMSGDIYANGLSSSGHTDEAIIEATKMYERAHSSSNKDYIANSASALASVYLSVFQFEQSSRFYEEVINIFKEKRPNNVTYILQGYIDLISSLIKNKQYNKANTYISEFDNVMATFPERNLKYIKDIFVVCKAFNQSFRISVLTKKGNYNKVATLIPLFHNQIDSLDENYRTQLSVVIMDYYYAIKDYKKAYEVIENYSLNSLGTDNMAYYDVEKADIVYRVGLHDKAFEMLKNSCNSRDSLLNLRLFNQLAFANSQYNVNKFKEENHSMKEKQSNIIMISISIVALLMLVIILSLVYHYRHQKALNLTLKKTAEQLSVAWKKAEESSRLKSSFLQNVSHELRTPLNSIVGFSDVLASRERDNEEDKMMANLIQHNSSLLLTLVNNLIQISTVESGSMNVNIQSCDFLQICGNSIDKVRNIVKDGVDVQLINEENIPHDDRFMIDTDPYILTEILTNILNNAAKFTEQGSISLSYFIDKEGANILDIVVSDTGIGIEPSKAEQIFERFEKINSFSQGFGLGLSICRLLVSLLGGTVTLNRTYTKGAQFIIKVPYTKN